MRAVLKTKPGRGIEIGDVPEPEVTPLHVKIEVSACGMCGSDLKIYRDDEHGPARFPLPQVMGHEPTGTVVAVGDGVTGLKEGDRVFADVRGPCGSCHYCLLGRFNYCTALPPMGSNMNGAFAQYTVVRHELVNHVPNNLIGDEAALLEPLGVCVHAVSMSSLKAGDSVLVVGPGPIGLLTAQVARAAGAAPVVVSGLGVDSERLGIAREYGFHTVDVENEDLEEVVREMTDGLGVDVVFEAAGAFEESVGLVKRGGELVWIAGPSKPMSVRALGQIRSNGLRVSGSYRVMPLDILRMQRLVSAGALDFSKMLTHRLSLEEADEAFQLLENRVGMKVVLKP